MMAVAWVLFGVGVGLSLYDQHSERAGPHLRRQRAKGDHERSRDYQLLDIMIRTDHEIVDLCARLASIIA